MNRPAGIMLLATSLMGLGSTTTFATDDAYQVLLGRQELFRRASETVAPFVVTIETIGGAQPRKFIDENEEPVTEEPETDDGTPPEEENLFRDDLGHSFLVADGPSTGVVYAPDGWILTSSFNFVRDPSHITVKFADGRHYVARLVARDRVRKLAMLKIDEQNLSLPEWVPTGDIQIGQTAIALGRGFGGDDPSVTVGVVSAKNRMMGNAIQTDAKLSPANYGGPLIDLQGRILGICVPMAQRPGELAGVEFYDAGVGFALPEHRVRELADVLMQGRSFDRGWLGIQIDPRHRGALKVHRVADPSPVWDLGIRQGDLIVEANGQVLQHIGHLRKAIYMLPAGESVCIVVRRRNLDFGYDVVLARSSELGQLAAVEPDVDLTKPFERPREATNRWQD